MNPALHEAQLSFIDLPLFSKIASHT